jgi:transposase-like protein
MTARIAPHLEESLVRAYRDSPEGGTLVARRHGVNSGTLYRVLKRNGVALDPRKCTRPRAPIFKLSQSVQQEIASLYEAGTSPSEIEQQFQCSRWMVLAVARRFGADVRRRGQQRRVWTGEERAAIAARYRAGDSQEYIAACYEADQTAISRILQAQGIATSRLTRERHPGWKGGEVKVTGGYIATHVAIDDPLASMRRGSGYVLKHRLVMARLLGRPLSDDETVHHIDGDRSNNEPSNLQLRQGRHGKGVRFKCATCGSHDVVEDTVA